MQHENFKTLSGNATKLLIDLLSQYKGNNNGDLCAAWSFMQARGWKSKGTLHRELKDLLKRGWVIVTRQGGRHKCSLYAVTWLPIDECGGKLDIAPTIVPSNEWKNKIATPYADQNYPIVVPIQQKKRASYA